MSQESIARSVLYIDRDIRNERTSRIHELSERQYSRSVSDQNDMFGVCDPTRPPVAVRHKNPWPLYKILHDIVVPKICHQIPRVLFRFAFLVLRVIVEGTYAVLENYRGNIPLDWLVLVWEEY